MPNTKEKLNNYIKLYFNNKQTRSSRSIFFKKIGLDVEYLYNKPVITNIENMYLSISHTNDIEVYLISNQPCGIDLEETNRQIDIKIINKLNLNKIKPLDDWMSIEAYYKMTQTSWSDLIKNKDIKAHKIKFIKNSFNGVILTSKKIQHIICNSSCTFYITS